MNKKQGTAICCLQEAYFKCKATYIQVKSKKMEKNWIDYINIKVDFRAKNNIREKEVYSIIIKGAVY